MNKLSKSFLQQLKSNATDKELDVLIDKICAFDETIDKLSIEYLKSAVNIQNIQGIEQRGINPGDNKQDYRVKSLSFCNFRTYPQHDPLYGVRFTNDSGEPCSLFLVGRNGTGKSTIFDALEWTYAGKANNADERGVNKLDEIIKFLTYGFGEVENVTADQVELKTELQDVDLLPSGLMRVSSMKPLCVPAICCSDRDIERIAQLDDKASGGSETNFQVFVREQLGFEEMNLLRGKLLAFEKEIKERTEKLDCRKRLAGLTSTDIKRVITLLTWFLTNSSEPSKKIVIDKIFDYDNIEYVKKVLESDDREKELNGFPEEFKNLWKELESNVALKKQFAEKEAGAGFKIENPEENLHDIDEKINAQCTRIVAIINRLKTAWDTYMSDIDGEGLANAMKSLNDDYAFLVDENSILPNSDKELSEISNSLEQLGKSLTQLKARLDKAFAHIFETEEQQEGGETKFQNVYPDQLNKFVETVLNHYKEPNETFVVKSTSNSFMVTISVDTKDGKKFETTPKRYFNTFRFRLYAVLLKISLSLYFMRNNNCIAPIVIDDVFNASDFENSINLNAFVCNIFEIYHEVVGYTYPLQLIMLTHDEMVTSAFMAGARMRTPKMQEHINNGTFMGNEAHCITGRLFHYSEAESIRREVGDTGEYLNLYLTTSL